jgi:hypothetical protein
MLRIKRFYFMLIALIILLSIGKNCYAGIFSVKSFYRNDLFDRLMILDKGKIDPLASGWTFMDNVFNQFVNQSPIMTKIKYVRSDSKRRRNLNKLQWDLEVKDDIYHIFVNRKDKTVTVRGEAEDREEKEQVEHIIKLRAPDNFEIINKIEVHNKDLG